MRCPDCGQRIDGPVPDQCPRCRAPLWTGTELPRLVARLLRPLGPSRCVVCKRDLTGVEGDRCPACSARYRAAV